MEELVEAAAEPPAGLAAEARAHFGGAARAYAVAAGVEADDGADTGKPRALPLFVRSRRTGDLVAAHTEAKERMEDVLEQ